MKKLSIKLKITIWSSLLMLMLVTLVLGFLMPFSSAIIETNAQRDIINVINDNADEIEYDDGELEIDDVSFFKSGVYTMLYTIDGILIEGNAPNNFNLEQSLQHMVINSASVGGENYYIYDKLIDLEDHESIWIRGIISIDKVSNVVNTIFEIALITLPFFVLFSSIGCYLISKRAFKPIEKIINAVNEIGDSEDLSLRIKLGDGSDEVYQLANTFDKMFTQLETSFEAEKQFSSDVSHELRTPTAVILAQCEYALGDNATADDKQEALEVVQRQAFKMSKLISDLLNINRLDCGIEKVNLKRVNFSEIVTDVCNEQLLLAPSNTTLNCNISSNIMAHLDHDMVIRLITNLINNAFRYGKKNGTVTITLLENETDIILSVEDDGIGIPSEHLMKIWQRFYQINPSRTAEQNTSMGLGLSMAKQISKLHGADISVKSERNVGSCFTVKFPK